MGTIKFVLIVQNNYLFVCLFYLFIFFFATFCISYWQYNQTKILKLKYALNIRLILYICDMIKRNELDVRNIDFELQAKRGDKFLCFLS